MLVSVSLILIVGMFMGWLCQKCRLPSLLGMLATGMVLGPYVLNLLDGSILGISPELRKMALIIILTRAGLGLDTSGLKKLGRPAVLMCFVPASFELMGVLLLAPKFMGLTFLEAAILGAVLAAVSPAVVVPRMVRLMDEGYGVKQGIPQLILAGASVDDVYVIVLFSTFVGMMQGESASLLSFVNIPVSILLGMAVGLAVGSLLACFFAKVHIRDTAKVLIILSISFLLVAAEDALTTAITFSALIAIMFIGIGLQKKRAVVAKRLSVKYGKLWVAAEVFLFVLVGATVNIGYLGKVGAKALLLIVGALVFRMLGVFVCLLGTSLSKKERLFAMMAYTPKATVQAAIGGIPLALGFACGDTVLTVAVSSNLQGAATLVGDTTSILLAGYAGMDFMDFFVTDGKPGMFWVVQAGAMATIPILFWIFRNEKNRIETTEITKVTDFMPTYALLATVISLVIASFIPNKPALTNGLICVFFFIAVLRYEVGRDEPVATGHDAVLAIDFDTLLLLSGLFVIIQAVTNVGLINDISNAFVSIAGDNLFKIYTILVWFSVLVSAFIDNIPYVATMLPVVSGISAQLGLEPTLLYFGLLAGATLGGNITPVGASANIAAGGILKKEGYEISAGQFMRIGVPFTLVAVVAGYVLIWLIYA